jgi:predicted N-formylglutamate amidohydrolase
MTFLFTCEHAGNRIPRELRGRFNVEPAVLTSHEGWDPGALRAARALATRFHALLLSTAISRLLVDANRSRHHPRVVARVPGFSRDDLLQRYWEPHRQAVAAAVLESAPCTHIAVHSFTPVLEGRARHADVGLLYDPGRPAERALALAWQRALVRRAPAVRVRRNYPYLGKADGLPTELRRQHAPETYRGFELELNQGALARDAAGLIAAVGEALAEASTSSERDAPFHDGSGAP